MLIQLALFFLASLWALRLPIGWPQPNSVSRLWPCCVFVNFDSWIETGIHDLHSFYLTISRLLNIVSNGKIAGSACPRPQFVEIENQDRLTPPHTTYPALVKLRSRDCHKMQNLQIFQGPKVCQMEISNMRQAALKLSKLVLWWLIWVWKILRVSVP